MTMHNVSELEGSLLDCAVAKAYGRGLVWVHTTVDGGLCMIGDETILDDPILRGTPYEPHKNWAYAGPIIESENIQLGPPTSPVHRHGGPNAGNGISGVWGATTWHRGANGRRAVAHHETSPLIAAMRCFVISRLGEMVELP